MQRNDKIRKLQSLVVHLMNRWETHYKKVNWKICKEDIKLSSPNPQVIQSQHKETGKTGNPLDGLWGGVDCKVHSTAQQAPMLSLQEERKEARAWVTPCQPGLILAQGFRPSVNV